MANKKITDLTAATDIADADLLEVVQLPDNKKAAWSLLKSLVNIFATASGTDTYTADLSPAITSYTTNLKVYIKFTNANTGASTINLNSLGAKSIKKSGGTDLAAGEISANQILCLVYDGTNFQVVGGGGASLTDPLVFKGVVDCSTNPNYPAADAGDLYKVSVAGKIGGGSGPNVEAGDSLLCIVDGSASGTQAGVGANWVILQTNIDPALYALLASPAFTGTPTAPTAAAGTNTTQLATTAFVIAEKLVSSFINWIFGIVTESGTTHTFALTDSGKIIRSTNAGTSTFTIPPNASIAYPTGSWIEFERTNGAVVLAPDSGVTFLVDGYTSNLTIGVLGGKVRATKVDTNTWHLVHSPGSFWNYAKTQVNEITAQWTITGTDNSSATYCFIVRNLAGDIIFRARNDQAVEFGGTSFLLEVATGIATGNARFRVNGNLASALVCEDKDGQEYYEIRSTTGDKAFVFKSRIEQNQGVGGGTGMVRVIKQFYLRLPNQTAGASHIVDQISIPSNYTVQVSIDNFAAVATDGSTCELAAGFQSIVKNVGGTTSKAATTYTLLGNPATTATLALVANNTDDRADLTFTNTTGTGKDFEVYGSVSYILRAIPV